VRWARALRDTASGIGALLATLERGKPAAATTDGLSYGIYPRESGGRKLVEYRGVGEYKYLVRVPDADLSVATICTAYEDMWTFGPRVAALFIDGDGPAQVRATAAIPATTDAPTIAVPVAELRRYVGEYVGLDGRGSVLRVTMPDSTLAIVPGSGQVFAMRPIGAARFEVAATGLGLFHVTFTASDTVAGGVLLATRDAVTGEEDPPLRRNVAVTPLSAAALRAYAGTYVGDDVDATLYVAVVDGRLTVEGRGLRRIALEPLPGRDRFRFDIYVARFQRDAAGRVMRVELDASRVKGIGFTRRAVR
jgi:hypothetical protein